MSVVISEVPDVVDAATSPAPPPSSPVPASSKPASSRPKRKAAQKKASSKSCTSVDCASLVRCGCGAILDHSGVVGEIVSSKQKKKQKSAAKAAQQRKAKSRKPKSAAAAASGSDADTEMNGSAAPGSRELPPEAISPEDEKKRAALSEFPVLYLAQDTPTLLKALRDSLAQRATHVFEAYSEDVRKRIHRCLAERGQSGVELAEAGAFNVEIEISLGVKLKCDWCDKSVVESMRDPQCACARREKFRVRLFEKHASAGFSDLPEDDKVVWKQCVPSPQ